MDFNTAKFFAVQLEELTVEPYGGSGNLYRDIERSFIVCLTRDDGKIEVVGYSSMKLGNFRTLTDEEKVVAQEIGFVLVIYKLFISF